MNKEQLITELSALAEKIVVEKSPHLVSSFNGREWFEQWMKIPNNGLGFCKPEELLEKDTARVKRYMSRIDIVPFRKPWGY